MRWIGASLLGVVCLAAGGAEAPGGAPVASGDVVLCPATRDVWISAVDGEQRYNMGAARRLKLKQWQELALIDFDVSALAGARVRRAALVVTPVGRARLGLNGGSDLAWLSVSTIAHEWTEGRSWRYAVDRSGHGATFLESSHGRDDWGFEGARVWDATLGNGNTLRQDGRLEPATSAITGERALRLELDPRLVEALVAGASHGLLLMDGSTDVGTNAFIASRESGDGAYLEVEVEPSAAAAPPPPIDVVALPAPGWATEVRGAAELTLRVPDGAFSYDVRIDGRAVERWQIPFAGKPGELQTLRLLDLEPDRRSRLEIEAVGATGRRSGAARVSVRSSGPLAADPLPPLPHLAAGSPPRLGRATVFALPELMRLDPVGGGVLGERGVGEIRRSNPVWSGADRRVVLSAARGEIVGFQVAIEGTADGIRIEPGGLGRVASGSPDAVLHEGGAEDRGDEVIGASHYRLWRAWHVDGYPEYALPLWAPVDLPSADNPVPDQSVQTIAVDLHVPTNATPGRYSGELVVVTSEGRLRLDVSLRVYDVTLPRRPTFHVELNTYRGPGRAGSERFIDSFRLAHYHRATINRVPYTHRGAVYDDWSPKLDAGGRIVDWSGFDRHLGGLLDGSWFADSPRAGVPAPVLYLPLFEGWPLDYRDHYRPGPGVPLRVREPLAKLRHDTLAPPLEEALDPRFKRAFVRAVRAFSRHIEAKGWDRTLFQVYLNNKPRYGYTLWTLDEPFEYLDWAAVNAFARLTRQALQQPELYAPASRSRCSNGAPTATDRAAPLCSSGRTSRGRCGWVASPTASTTRSTWAVTPSP